MDLLAPLLAAAAIVCACLAAGPRLATSVATAAASSWSARLVEHRRRQLLAARLTVDPRGFTVACLVSPPALFLVGWALGSPVLAAVAAGVGLVTPRLYLDALVQAQQRRTEAEAPRLLQVVLASLTAGRTYLEALQEARHRITDRWLRDDLDHIVTQFHLDVPLETSIAEVRARTTGRNLGLVWDNLAICIANRIPAARAKGLLVELAATVQFNVQLQQEVKARTAGQRTQIWLLAAVVPGLFLYLRLLDRDFFTVLDDTAVGRFVLVPLAALLEVAGIALSFRVSRVEI